MVKAVLFLLHILFATNAVLTKSAQPENELKYIGTFRSKSTVGGSTRVIDGGNYFVSMNTATWNAATADCRNQLGADAGLVAIESEEEWNFLKEFLEDYGFATSYWTSGIYDTSVSRWKWSVNTHVLPPFAPWGAGYPGTPNGLVRVQIYYINRFEAYWRTFSNTQLNRYICEIQVPTIAVPCYETNDLAIVLDSSGSIGAGNFEVAKQFVERLAYAFTVHAQSQLSFITYSDSVYTRIVMTNSLSRGQISTTILTTPWEAGNTYTNLGIDAAVTQLISTERGVPMNMVVLTDGASTVPSLTLEAANRAIGRGIRTFSVGITPSINQQELLAIAGNDPNRVFTTANFDELINLLAPLSLKVCPG